MTALIEHIKVYFSKKEQGDKTIQNPEGMCPNCWAHSEWDGHYYEVIKDKHLTPETDIYKSFISKIVDKHVATTHKHKDKYICTTCDQEL